MNARFGKLRSVCLVLPFVFAMPCSAQSDAVNEWKRKIAAQLRARFQPPRCSSYRTVDVDFTIDRSGIVKSTKLVKGAGIPELDAAALAAAETAQPFPPAPAEVDDSQLKIAVTFACPDLGADNREERLKADERLKERLRGICRGC